MSLHPIFSPQAELVWQALLKKHQELVNKSNERPNRRRFQYDRPDIQSQSSVTGSQEKQSSSSGHQFYCTPHGQTASSEEEELQNDDHAKRSVYSQNADQAQNYNKAVRTAQPQGYRVPTLPTSTMTMHNAEEIARNNNAIQSTSASADPTEISRGQLIQNKTVILDNPQGSSVEFVSSSTNEPQEISSRGEDFSAEVLQTSSRMRQNENTSDFVYVMENPLTEKRHCDRSSLHGGKAFPVSDKSIEALPQMSATSKEKMPDIIMTKSTTNSVGSASATPSKECQNVQIGSKTLQKRQMKRSSDLFKVPRKVIEKKKRRRDPESAADKALQDLEEIMDASQKTYRKEGEFNNSCKKTPKENFPSKRIEARRVTELSEEERLGLRAELLDAPELALTLSYTDGASLLGPAPGQGKVTKSTQLRSLKNVVIAYPKKVEDTSELAFVAFPLANISHPDTWARTTLVDIMIGKGRKICYKADELIIAIQKSANVKSQEAAVQWTVLDPGVAHWLLHSDHPARSFADVLSALPDISTKSSETETVCGRLRLVGPVMARLYAWLKAAHLWDLFLNLETPLTPILAAMHLRGIKVDTKELLKTANLLERKLSKLEEAAHMSAGKKFCLNSHPQLRQVLFEDLHLDKKLEQGSKIARTLVEGQKSTSQSVLHLLKDTHSLPALVLEHRQLQKLKSTYVDGILSCVQSSGWVHARWAQVSASTGRLAATQPNLQAVPKVPVPIRISQSAIVDSPMEIINIFARDPFHSREGYTLLAADFQQIEFRLLAHLSSDSTLLSIFNKNPETDIFVELTAQWLNKQPSDVTQADREQTKRVVYSVMYGVGKERLSDYLKIDTTNAKDIMQSFLVAYPGVNSFTKSCIAEAQKQGYQTTMFGRRRQLPHINHPAHHVRSQAERQAVNFCVQGSAADLCKAAMILVERALASAPHVEARLLLQIHDELLFEVHNNHLTEVAGLIKATMEDADSLCGGHVHLKVPLTVSLTTGRQWGHMEVYSDKPDGT